MDKRRITIVLVVVGVLVVAALAFAMGNLTAQPATKSASMDVRQPAAPTVVPTEEPTTAVPTETPTTPPETSDTATETPQPVATVTVTHTVAPKPKATTPVKPKATIVHPVATITSPPKHQLGEVYERDGRNCTDRLRDGVRFTICAKASPMQLELFANMAVTGNWPMGLQSGCGDVSFPSDLWKEYDVTIGC